MNKKLINILLFFISSLLGLFLIFQYNTSKQISGNSYMSSHKIAILNDKLEQLELQKQQLEEKLLSTEEKLKIYEDEYGDSEGILDSLYSELEKYKVMSCQYDVKGPGVIVTINDPAQSPGFNDPNLTIVNNYQYILSIISNLNSAGAEAISINGQRYTSYTEIVPVSNYLNINGMFFVPPIEIKAIGNSRTLESSLNFMGGVVEQMRNYYGFDIEIDKSDKIEINGILKDKEFQYAKPYDANMTE